MKYSILILLSLLACAQSTPEPKAGSAAWLAKQDPATRASYYAALCQGQGYPQGSQDFAACVQDQSANFKLQLIRNDFAARAMN